MDEDGVEGARKKTCVAEKILCSSVTSVRRAPTPTALGVNEACPIPGSSVHTFRPACRRFPLKLYFNT